MSVGFKSHINLIRIKLRLLSKTKKPNLYIACVVEISNIGYCFPNLFKQSYQNSELLKQTV